MKIDVEYGVDIMARSDSHARNTNDPSEFRPPRSAIGWHQPVLVSEVVQCLQPVPGTTFVDCTLGTGGHSLAILPRLLPAGAGTPGRLIGIDCDADALAQARQRLVEFRPYVELAHDTFSHLPEILARAGLTHVHGLLADVGMSSLQVDDPARGFSFRHDGPLDMRMDQRSPTTAADLIRSLPEDEMADLLSRVGEERWARRIAGHLVDRRSRAPILTTAQLAQAVAEAVPRRAGSTRLHPATRTFMALRIAVNDELLALQRLLEVLPEVLLPGGRASIITFHSLEDRLVKRAFQQGARDGVFRLLTKKPLRPSAREAAANPRSRSAKLRAVERCS